MQLIDHSGNVQSFYHFESSDEYCTPEKIDAAASILRSCLDLNKTDIAQLDTIVKLEHLRYAYATSDMTKDELSKAIQEARNLLIKEFSREPFDNEKVEKIFYRSLNSEYGHVFK